MFSGSFILVEHKSSKSLNYKNLTKSRCHSPNIICRNVFQYLQKTHLCKQNRINTPNKLSNSDGPGNK